MTTWVWVNPLSLPPSTSLATLADSQRTWHLVSTASRGTFHISHFPFHISTFYICGNCERSLCAICPARGWGRGDQGQGLLGVLFLLITGKYKWPSLWFGHFNFMQLDQLKARRGVQAGGRGRQPKTACHVYLPQLEALQLRNFLFASFPLLAQFSAGTRTLPFFFSQCTQWGRGGVTHSCSNFKYH